MTIVYDFATRFLDVISTFGQRVIEVFSARVWELIDKLPDIVEWVTGLVVMKKIIPEDMTLLALCFGGGVVVWLTWALIKFFLPTS